MSTGIEWTEETWNPVTGCDRVSPGCDNCYALTMAGRLKAMGQPKYQRDGDPRTSGPGFGVTVHPDVLDQPLRWRRPRRVFVNSMSDLFHDAVSDEFIARVFAVMASCPQHTFQILTKRHGRMRSLLSRNDFGPDVALLAETEFCGSDRAWPLPNVWLGASAEDQKRADLRIPALLETPAAVRFISAEPLLGPVDLSRWLRPVGWPKCWDDHEPTAECSRCIQPDWVIVGGESGHGARPMHPDWVRALVNQCRSTGVPVFVKQMGSAGRSSKGSDMDAWPVDLRVREFPRGASS